MNRTQRKRKITWFVDAKNCFVCNSHSITKKYDPSDKCEYIRIHDCGKGVYVHRYIYEQCFGMIPDGMIVRHKCDNPWCINPEHLQIGTHIENMIDRDKSGRTARGIRAGSSKLSEENVLFIRQSNKKTSELSKIFSVTTQTILSVKQFQTYKFVGVSAGNYPES